MKEGREGKREGGERERERERGERSVLTTSSTHLKESQGETKSNTFCEASKTTTKSENLKILNFSFFCRRAPSRKITAEINSPNTSKFLRNCWYSINTQHSQKRAIFLKKSQISFFSKILKNGPFCRKKPIRKNELLRKILKNAQNISTIVGALSKHKILKRGPFLSNAFSQKFSKMALSAEESPFEKNICRELFKNLKISQNVWCFIKTQNSF